MTNEKTRRSSLNHSSFVHSTFVIDLSPCPAKSPLPGAVSSQADSAPLRRCADHRRRDRRAAGGDGDRSAAVAAGDHQGHDGAVEQRVCPGRHRRACSIRRTTSRTTSTTRSSPAPICATAKWSKWSSAKRREHIRQLIDWGTQLRHAKTASCCWAAKAGTAIAASSMRWATPPATK